MKRWVKRAIGRTLTIATLGLGSFGSWGYFQTAKFGDTLVNKSPLASVVDRAAARKMYDLILEQKEIDAIVEEAVNSQKGKLLGSNYEELNLFVKKTLSEIISSSFSSNKLKLFFSNESEKRGEAVVSLIWAETPSSSETIWKFKWVYPKKVIAQGPGLGIQKEGSDKFRENISNQIYSKVCEKYKTNIVKNSAKIFSKIVGIAIILLCVGVALRRVIKHKSVNYMNSN